MLAMLNARMADDFVHGRTHSPDGVHAPAHQDWEIYHACSQSLSHIVSLPKAL